MLSYQTSEFLVCTGFGFALPAGATVQGIVVNVERSRAVGTGVATDAKLRLVRGGLIQTTERATTTAYSDTDVIEAHGGPSDLWGAAWTPADVNASGFGATLAVQAPLGPSTPRVDAITMTVYYR
jgi:hypothetical protein